MLQLLTTMNEIGLLLTTVGPAMLAIGLVGWFFVDLIRENNGAGIGDNDRAGSR